MHSSVFTLTFSLSKMEKLRRAVNQIAYHEDLQNLTQFQRSLLPVLSFASAFYKLALSLRHHFYGIGLFHKHRLPVPVISVGNLTWGGNGKTPMVEFLARWFADSGISPLILTRGYAGGDEANMLQRHLILTSTKIGVGANRETTAVSFLQKYGYIDTRNGACFEGLLLDKKVRFGLNSDKIGAAILDDGMQHLTLWRDLEIVMVNGMVPWGNHKLIPLGPLREPLTALGRADVVVVHHADLLSEAKLKDIELMIRDIREALPIFFSGMAPSYFFEIGNISSKIPLTVAYYAITLCVSAIGFAKAFVQGIEKIGPRHVDQLEFSDHYLFQPKDIELIRTRLKELQRVFGMRPIVIVTEKDYDRDPEILKQLNPYQVLVLCSELQIIPRKGCTEESFKKLLKQLLQGKYRCKLDIED